jgi:hypothetical protein
MRPLKGFIKKVSEGEILIKTESNNCLPFKTKKKFKLFDKILINYDYEQNQIASVEKAEAPIAGTVVKHTCSKIHLELDIPKDLDYLEYQN